MTSVTPSSRILRSSRGKRLQAIPWETLQHIFSYCDQATLFAISLVSFGCWELAGPLLYENIEINDLDGLASLFFIKVVPSSPRLAHTSSLFSRIRTLTLDVDSWDQERGPCFDPPGVDEERGQDDFDAVALQLPHRLLAFTIVPLPLESLLIPGNSNNIFSFFALYCIQLFPHLNPAEVVHRKSVRRPFVDWARYCIRLPTSFFTHWTQLRRVVYAGYVVIVLPPQWDGRQQDPLYSFWSPPAGEEKRAFELVFEMMYGYESLRSRRTNLEVLLSSSGVVKGLAGKVDLKVVLKVLEEDREIVHADVLQLPGWMSKLVEMEVL